MLRRGRRSRSRSTRLPGRRALAGERPPPLTVRYRQPRERRGRWSRVQSTPVFDDDGAVRLAINVIEDITDLKRAEHRPPVPGRGEPRARGLARLPADAAHGRPARGPGSRRLVRGRPRRRRRHRARGGRARRPGAGRARARDAASATRPTRGRTRASTACCDTAPPSCTGRSPTRCSSVGARPEHLELLRSVGLRSAMLAPMRLRDRVLGVISFVSAESGRRFDEHDLALAEDLALRAAAAVENARLYETASSIAATLQSSLLPPVLPEIPAMEIAAAYRPAGHRPRGRRRLLRRVQHRRRPVVRGDRRRLRQGRRGGRGDRARALHDPRGGGPPPLAERDPALAQRRDDPAVATTTAASARSPARTSTSAARPRA